MLKNSSNLIMRGAGSLYHAYDFGLEFSEQSRIIETNISFTVEG
jgi:hypothetical protein